MQQNHQEYKRGDEYDAVVLVYGYRDAQDKFHDASILVENPGKLSLSESQGRLKRACVGGEHFSALQVNLPEMFSIGRRAPDTPLGEGWHEFFALDIVDADATKNGQYDGVCAMTLGELVQAFEERSSQGWREEWREQEIARHASARPKG